MLRRTTSRYAPVPLASLDYKVSSPSASIQPGASIMACHGLLGSGENWKNFAFRLSKHKSIEQLQAFSRVSALDMRNHGRSPHTQQHTCALIASDIENHALKQQRGGNLIIAHSMSGYATMHSMIRQANRSHYLEGATASDISEHHRRLRQQRVDRLLHRNLYHDSMCPSTTYTNTIGGDPISPVAAVKACVIIDVCPSQMPPTTFPDILHDMDAMRGLPLHTVGNLRDAYDSLKDDVKSIEEMKNHLLTNLETPSSGGDLLSPRWRANLSVLLHDLHHVVLPDHPAAVVEKAHVPTLFVFGRDSPYNTVEGRAHIDHFFSNATQVEIPNCGHFVHIEKRDELAQLVADFAAAQQK